MTEEKQNIAIYKLLGFEPRKMWRVWYNKDKSHGSCSLPSREEALKRIEIEKTSWGYKKWIEEYEFSEPEEYEDWFHCPQVDLDLLHGAEKIIYEQRDWIEWLGYCNKLLEVKKSIHLDQCIHADVKERREALLKTLNLWEE